MATLDTRFVTLEIAVTELRTELGTLLVEVVQKYGPDGLRATRELGDAMGSCEILTTRLRDARSSLAGVPSPESLKAVQND